MQMRKNGLRPWRHVVIKTEIPAGWRRFAYMCRFVVLACATLAVFAAEMPERTPMLLNPRHVLRLRGGSTIGAKDDEVICASHRSRPHHTRNRDLEEDAPKPRKLEDALQKLAEQGCEFEDEGGLGGLIALNEECAKWVESGIGVPAGFTEELLGCRFEPPPSIDSTEEDIVEGDKALEGQNGLGDKRGTEDEIVAAGGSLNAIGLAPNGSQKPEGNGEDGRVSEQCERGRPSRDRKNAAQRRKSETSAQYEAMTDEEKQVEARELLAEIEEDAAAMLQVGIKSDFALVRAAMRMIQPNATKAVRPIRSGDVVVDLGCGDGRVCIEATLAFNCSSCGVDIDIQAIEEGRNVVGALELVDQITLLHGDLMEYDFMNASLVYAFVPPELLEPRSPLYSRLYAYLLRGGMVITAYSVLDYLAPADVCLLDKSRQAFLYTRASCDKAYVQDPVMESRTHSAPMVVPMGRQDEPQDGIDETGLPSWLSQNM